MSKLNSISLAENTSVNALPISRNGQNDRVEYRVPPHTCRPVWIDRLFEAIRDLNPSKITQEFVAANVVGSNHEGKVLVALRFLGLISENGDVTSRLSALRVIGPEFTANLAIVVQQAYSELLSTISIKTSPLNRLISLLMQKYSMTQTQAQSAARFFVHLASLAAMELSDELSNIQASKQDASSRKEPMGRLASVRPTINSERMGPKIQALATIDGPFGQIRIVDASSLELARKLLDIVENQLRVQGGAINP